MSVSKLVLTLKKNLLVVTLTTRVVTLLAMAAVPRVWTILARLSSVLHVRYDAVMRQISKSPLMTPMIVTANIDMKQVRTVPLGRKNVNLPKLKYRFLPISDHQAIGMFLPRAFSDP